MKKFIVMSLLISGLMIAKTPTYKECFDGQELTEMNPKLKKECSQKVESLWPELFTYELANTMTSVNKAWSIFEGDTLPTTSGSYLYKLYLNLEERTRNLIIAVQGFEKKFDKEINSNDVIKRYIQNIYSFIEAIQETQRFLMMNKKFILARNAYRKEAEEQELEEAAKKEVENENNS